MIVGTASRNSSPRLWSISIAGMSCCGRAPGQFFADSRLADRDAGTIPTGQLKDRNYRIRFASRQLFASVLKRGFR
jgi:hypothetical protein